MNLKHIFFSKLSYLFLFITLCISCESRTNVENGISSDKFTNMAFEKEVYNFGVITMGKSVSTTFKFVNSGNNPLLINEVVTSCGCTVPKWSKEIIKPNEISEITVVYDAKYPGQFNKTIKVVYNGKNSPKQLIITGNVPYPKKKEN